MLGCCWCACCRGQSEAEYRGECWVQRSGRWIEAECCDRIRLLPEVSCAGVGCGRGCGVWCGCETGFVGVEVLEELDEVGLALYRWRHCWTGKVKDEEGKEGYCQPVIEDRWARKLIHTLYPLHPPCMRHRLLLCVFLSLLIQSQPTTMPYSTRNALYLRISSWTVRKSPHSSSVAR